VTRALQDQGAVVAAWTHPDPSAQAAEANGFQADVYLGVDLLDEPGCRCSYYCRPDYESAGGRRLAERLAEALPGAIDGAGGTTHPMQLAVLRETRMVAVWVELGPPTRVVETTPAIARAVVRCLVDWAAAPVEG
jgi:hypothetical protein